MKCRARLLACALAASTMLWSGCAHRANVIPDSTVPHQLAAPLRAEVWVEKGDGKKVAVPVYVPAGWWIAGPPVVEGDHPLEDPKP